MTDTEASGPEGRPDNADVEPEIEADLEAYVDGAGTPSRTHPPGPRPRTATRIAVAIGVAVALVAGALVVSTLNTTDASSTPEGAVRALAAAIGEEDVLGVIEALVPGERSVLLGRVPALAKELGRLGLLDEGLDLGRVPGADLSVDALELRTEPLADDVAAVVITGGTVSVAVAVAALPLGPVARGLLGGSDRAGLSLRPPPEELSGRDLRLVAVRENGEWFVSLGYTAAEAARRAFGAGAPSPQQRVVPRGEASPEAVVREMVRAAAALDARRLVELTTPGEAAALHAYAALFLPLAEGAAGQARAAGLSVDVSSLEVSTDGSGPEARVTVDRLGIRATTADGPATFDYDGRCFRYTSPHDGDSADLCLDDPEYRSFGAFRAGTLSFTTVERDGAWFLSPVGTYLDSILVALRSAEQSDLERAVADHGVLALAPLFSVLPFPLLGGLAGSTVASEQGEERAAPLESVPPTSALPQGQAPTPPTTAG